MAEAVIQPAWEIGKCCWPPIGKRINYVRKLSVNWGKFRQRLESELVPKRNDIVAEIERLGQQKKPTEECVTWTKEVGEIEEKIKTIKVNVKKRCLGILCPDICARVKLGKEVEEMEKKIDDLVCRSKFENGYLADPPPAKVEEQLDSASNLSSSAKHTLDAVLEKVQDVSSPTIGIYGMGGVGKTTVLKLLNDSPEVKPLFDVVIWVTVSKSPTIRGLQKQIADRLKITIATDASDDTVKRELLNCLRGKKYMLLLDDVWEEVGLSAVGIPDPNRENGCKVVLTTRKMDVCRKMRTKHDVPVAILPHEEAWEMFCSEVGNVATLPTIRPCAEQIVKECGGLPLALKVVSGALRNQENEYVWRHFLTGLRSPATTSIGDLEDDVFRILKMSYDTLKTIKEKKCLLFCGLYPEDTNIAKSELIKYWRAEGILSKKCTLAVARDMGEAILQGLIDASLLQKCGMFDECVKMHDLIRDMVLALIASAKGEEPQQLVSAGISSEEIPNAMDWEKATRISFIDRDLRDLPESPNCPELLTLLLQGNTNLEVIPETFFNKMPKLRVLDLSRTGIKSLPTSISKLDNLQVLVLLGCYHLVSFPHGVLCSLSQIEVFELRGVELDDESTEIVAKELSCLNSLSSLEINFRGVLPHFLENSMSWREGRLTQFLFEIGDVVYVNYGRLRYLHYKYGSGLFYGANKGGEESRSDLSSALVKVLQRSNFLLIEDHEKLNNLSELCPHSTYELRECCIEEGIEQETIINRHGQEMDPFSDLEALVLNSLRNLKSILSLEMDEGPLLPPPPNTRSFTNPKMLQLYRCPKLEQLFSSASMVQQLSNLEELVVHYCDGLKGTISDDQKLEYEALPKLRTMILIDLPECALLQ